MRGKMVAVGVMTGLAMVAGLGFYWPFGRRAEVLRLPGVVEIQEVRLGPRVGGRVAAVCVREGDPVEAGQVLLRLDVPELPAQRDQAEARLREAQAQLDKARNGPRYEEIKAARAAVEAAQARLDRLEKGFRDEEIRQAREEKEAADADLRLAREEFGRGVRMLSQGALSRSELDTLRAGLERHQGRTAAARARYDLMEAGTRREEIEEGRAEVKRVRANLELLQAGTRPEEVAAAEARVAEAQGRLRELDVNRAEATVRAPEPAVVEVLAVRRGDLVAANQPVVRVLRRGDLWVKVYVAETDLGKVRLGQAVEVTVDSYPGRRFAGKVTQIAGESEFTPRNVQSLDERHHQVFGVRVHVEDPQGVFKSGMAAEVEVPLQ